MPKLTLAEVIQRGRKRVADEHHQWVEDGGPERARQQAEEDRLARIRLGEEDEEGNCLIPEYDDDEEEEKRGKIEVF